MGAADGGGTGTELRVTAFDTGTACFRFFFGDLWTGLAGDWDGEFCGELWRLWRFFVELFDAATSVATEVVVRGIEPQVAGGADGEIEEGTEVQGWAHRVPSALTA
jgi:hypothetical protein